MWVGRKRLGLVALLLACRVAVAEPPLVVERAVTTDGDDATEAQAASLRLRDGLTRERREVLVGTRLMATATKDPTSLRVRGTLAPRSRGAELTLEVLNASGALIATSSAVGNFDGAAMVERAIVPLRSVLGEGSAVPRVAAARLAVYAQAEALQLAGDLAGASARLAYAEPSVALASAAARDIARAICGRSPRARGAARAGWPLWATP